MFGPPKPLRRLAELLGGSCPPWDPRITDFGGELAVVIDTSERTRSLFFVRRGYWHTLTVVLDEDGDPLPGAQVEQTRIAERDPPAMHRVAVAAQVGAYRNAVALPDGDPFEFMREAAHIALPYLTPGGR